MDALPFETPEFAALLDASDAQIAGIIACCKAQGITFPAFAAMYVDQAIVAEARAATGYQASETSARAARANTYTRGAVKAPRRETRAQAIARTAKFLHRGAA
jgi:hypothetical protein